MKINLKRITPRINEKFIFAFIDLDLPDFKVKLKGVRFTIKGNATMVHMPQLMTEKGIKFTAFNFMNDEDYQDFKSSLLETIQKEYPLVKWQNGIYQIKDEEEEKRTKHSHKKRISVIQELKDC
jgi:hypothetical protein